ncbi:exodeoxyribonuclease III [Tessaracoccus sp. OS52]|uniref:exodeoxyribonuclease III n=1 Tax=Tessaracoccus sp. OS52 TaxID=2886691 RepID=UPI001D12FACF|nr:exodeoxyribonuclease III [Tessaracoccus sp. OS52]
MRIATWNVNSAKQRMPRLLPWLEERRPDVVCLQETKLTDAAFFDLFSGPLTDLGYEVAHHGQGGFNGVALLSRVGLADVEANFPGQPDFEGKAEARALSAVCDGVRVYSLYVPNGREVASDHYGYKLEWLDALAAATASAGPDVALCGDMNIAPADADLFDPRAFVGHTHVTEPERQRLAALGLVDVVRARWPEHDRLFSYWDYRAGMFHQDLGMRIDLVLASQPVADRVAAAWVDRAARKGKLPSDHAPVIVDLDHAPDGDIGPVVPPPSNPKRGGRVRLPQSVEPSE